MTTATVAYTDSIETSKARIPRSYEYAITRADTLTASETNKNLTRDQIPSIKPYARRQVEPIDDDFIPTEDESVSRHGLSEVQELEEEIPANKDLYGLPQECESESRSRWLPASVSNLLAETFGPRFLLDMEEMSTESDYDESYSTTVCSVRVPGMRSSQLRARYDQFLDRIVKDIPFSEHSGLVFLIED